MEYFATKANPLPELYTKTTEYYNYLKDTGMLHRVREAYRHYYNIDSYSYNRTGAVGVCCSLK